MKDGERQLLGAIVICGMLIGALLATWPHGTPATSTPSPPLCSVAGAPEHIWFMQPGDRSCLKQDAP